MNILITGIAGFIGSNLADRLIKELHNVWGIDNLTTGQSRNVNAKVKGFSVSSITSYYDFANLFQSANPDVVIHAAASYKDPNRWYDDTNTNVLGTINTIQLSKKFNVKRLIYFQTSLCYGIPQTQPITLNHPLAPFNSYSITKTAAEEFISISDLDFVSFRLANVFGKRNISGPIPTFYKRIDKKEKCFISQTRRDFVFIDDLVGIVMKAVNGVGSGYYHISTGNDFSISSLYYSVASAMNFVLKDKDYVILPVNSDDVETILLDPSRTLDDFGVIPSTPLESGITKTIEYYNEFGVGETFTHLKQNN